MGIAMKKHIWYYFTRWRYENLPEALQKLERKGSLIPVVVPGVKGAWHMHADDLGLLEGLRAGNWEPRTTFLSPFDPLIADRGRTKLMWDFDFAIEIYVPKAKRKYGYYVLPILHDEKLIGRIDPLMDRKTGTLTINAVYREPTAPTNAATAKKVKRDIERFASWLGADQITYSKKLPPEWSPVLRS
jgi:uncharacterized protein YcaQ